MFINEKNIVSITDLSRNLSKITNNINKKKEPVCIFKNNAPSFVLLDYQTYKNMIDNIYNKNKKEIDCQIEKVFTQYDNVFKELAK